MKLKILLVLGLGAVLLPILMVRSTRPPALGLEGGRLRPCPESPNCVCSQSTEASSRIAPLAFQGDPAAAFASLIEFLEAEPRVTLEEVGTTYAHAVFRTRFLRFRDDVEFLLDPEAHVIHVRSASRIGYSDLGKNRERVEDLRSRWRAPGGPGTLKPLR
ncbi:MAG TPA: DUF1499 domain-containing protein [Planctomycetes bacterium]|nr:DUF1499 domain-containing protein [Planctomycetota bacterium]